MIFAIEALGITCGGGKAGLMRLVPALARHSEHRFIVMVADLPEFAGLSQSNVKLIVRSKPRSLIAREVHLQRTVPQICAAERADALLCLGNFTPRHTAVPSVVLLHNAQYVAREHGTARQTLRERLVAWYGRRMLRKLPEGALVVVQTNVMKQKVVEAYPPLATRVIVIPDGHGLQPGLPSEEDVITGEGRQRMATDHGTGNAEGLFTFLCLAHYYPHKNLESLVDAFRLLRASTSLKARCLLTVDPGRHPGARRLMAQIEAQGLADLLVNVGPLTGGRVAEAYRSADALLLPTLLESFGRPYIEAMRFGLPIVTSDRDFARHACGDAALYFDPLDPASIARSMARIIESTDLRRELGRAGIERARQAPSWDEIAARFIAVLEALATGNSKLAIRGLELAPLLES